MRTSNSFLSISIRLVSTNLIDLVRGYIDCEYSASVCTPLSIYAGTTQKGLMEVDVAEGVKLQLCNLLNHMCDIQLRHRVESLIAFSEGFVGEVQSVSRLTLLINRTAYIILI